MSVLMEVFAAGDLVTAAQLQNLTAGAQYRLALDYRPGFGPLDRVTAWLELQEVGGPRVLLTDGRNLGANGRIRLGAHQDQDRHFVFDFLAPGPLTLVIGIESWGDYGSLKLDLVKAPLIWTWNFYSPYLMAGTAPRTEQGSSDFVGGQTLGTGSLSISVLDGVMLPVLAALDVFSRRVRLMSAGSFIDGSEILREDWRTQALGLMRDHSATHQVATIATENARSYFVKGLPTRKWTLPEFANLFTNKVDFAQPIVLGEAPDFASGENVPFLIPTRIDKTAQGYGIYQYADPEISPGASMFGDPVVYAYEDTDVMNNAPRNGHVLSPGVSITIDRVRGRFTIIDNVKAHNFRSKEAVPPGTLDFKIGGVAKTRAGSLAFTANEVAAIETAAMTAAGGTAITVSYDHSTIGGPITSNSVANPTVLATPTPHGLTNGTLVVITGIAGSSPTVEGQYVATVVDPTHFSVPVNVTVGGTGGTFGQGKRFKESVAGGTFDLNTKTGPNVVSGAPQWESLGYKTDGDRTGSLAYLADKETFTDADKDHILLVRSSGFRDDVTGKYTGTPFGLIRLAPDMARVLFQHSAYINLPEDQVAVAEFDAARAGEGQSPCWMVLDKVTEARQALGILENTMLADLSMDGEGVIHCSRYKAAGASKRVFYESDYIKDSWSCGRLWSTFRNKVRLYYGYDPRQQRWMAIDVVSAAAAARAVVEEPLEIYTYFAYTGAAQARANDFLALAVASPFRITFSARGKLLDLRVGDKITINAEHVLAPGGRFVAVDFRIRALSFDHSTGIGRCTAVQYVTL